MPRYASSSLATSSFVPFLALSSRQSRMLHKRLFHSRPSRRCSFPAASLKIGVEEVAELAQNKVLISAALACAIGQLSKPFTSTLTGNGLDLWAAVRAGGMPSSHSAGVMAATTCLGLESLDSHKSAVQALFSLMHHSSSKCRGFSDPIFGMSAVFAVFVMYDAQGVRREVGNHAKVLNRTRKQQGSSLFQEKDNSVDSTSTVNANERSLAPLFSSSDNTNSYMPEQDPFPISTTGKASNGSSPSISGMTIDGDDSSEKATYIYSPLNESVGHTEIQVIVGALLGFVVSLATEAIA
ncbi:hypothetical protein Taro_008006 [Colocasia esculenta]|uniref:Acid phosphatase/vanadium-dependent haloperoxidase-related protein n=1 Tax=Colocasia esculenta TaxID=4460 RepID=A0A843TZU2_COLES|nr:hypothetical protein [Colocasia esculenta]